MQGRWMAVGCALLSGIALAACGGGSSGGGTAAGGQPSSGGSDDTAIVGDTGGSSGNEGNEGSEGGGDVDTGCNDQCPPTYCWNFCTEKDVSYVLVETPCPELITDIRVTDQNDGSLLGNLYPGERSSAICDESFTGFKVEDVDSRSIRLCVTTTLPPEELTIQLKAGLTCETITGACE